jgi:hypothetical protein
MEAAGQFKTLEAGDGNECGTLN